MNQAAEILSNSTSRAYIRFCAVHRIEPDFKQMDKNPKFKDWLNQQGTPEAKPSHHKNSKERLLENLTRLAPDFERRRKLFTMRLKTLLRIYLSKWFYKGLQFHEFELVRYLLDRLNYHFEILTDKVLYNTIGSIFFAKAVSDDSEKMDGKGWDLLEHLEVSELIFPEKIFNDILKLRSFQGLRDHIFTAFLKEEHEGKLGINKPRIRGYRDGKASPRDPTLIKQALALDVKFYCEEQEKRMDSYFSEIEKLTTGF